MEVALLNLAEEAGHGGLVKGKETGEQHVEDHADGPHVGRAAVVALVGQHLGGNVVGSAARRVRLAANYFRKTEVCKLDLTCMYISICVYILS